MKMNYEQVIFYKGKRRLGYLADKGEMTPAEEAEVDTIRSTLWGLVVSYAMDETRKRLDAYITAGAIASDALADIQQDMAVMFLERLGKYDPTRATPTTYFKPYIHEVISKYLHTDIKHMSHNDAANARAVNRAVDYYESLNVRWSEEMVADRTGLSPRVVKRTLRVLCNSKRSNIDDDESVLQLKSRTPGPEETYEQKERDRILWDSLASVLSDEDRSLLLMRVNPEGDRYLSYEKCAAALGVSVRTIKVRLNDIICRLNADENLVQRFGRDYQEPLRGSYAFRDHSTDITEQQLMEHFGAFASM